MFKLEATLKIFHCTFHHFQLHFNQKYGLKSKPLLLNPRTLGLLDSQEDEEKFIWFLCSRQLLSFYPETISPSSFIQRPSSNFHFMQLTRWSLSSSLEINMKPRLNQHIHKLLAKVTASQIAWERENPINHKKKNWDYSIGKIKLFE